MKKPGKILPVTLRQLVSKPATVRYPAGPEKQFPNLRAKITFDAELCVGCNACVRDCPTDAIEILTVGEKQYKAILKTDSCVFCSQCVDSCPKDALHYTPTFELATLNRESLRADI